MRSPNSINFDDKGEVINYCKGLESQKYPMVVWEWQGNIPSNHSRFFIGFRSRMREQYGKTVKAVYITGYGEIR